MKEFDRIKDMIYEELDGISHDGKLSKDTVCVIGELVDILKDIGSIEMFEENIYVEDNGTYHTPDERGGYSNRMPRRYYDGGYQYGGNSYRYGGTRMRGGYSREDGKAHMVEKLNHLMNEAQNDEDREAIRRLIHEMESK